MALANVRVVLVRPQGSANVGSVARAMKNMGLADLVLVEAETPEDGWAETMAVHARDVLARAQAVSSLAEAVGDCAFVVATASRPGLFRGQILTPREASASLLNVARRQPVALVFGPEDHGLSNADLGHCHALITIPTAPEYPSLNLAQAVMVCVYELAVAAGARDAGEPVPETTEAMPTAASLERMFHQLERALLAAGFLNPQNPDPVMNVFRRILARADLREHDVRVLMGLARQVQWLADQVATPDSQYAGERTVG